MKTRTQQLVAIIGASEKANRLRRLLVQRRIECCGVASHFRGLRRMVHTGELDAAVVCLDLGADLASRFGPSLGCTLSDLRQRGNNIWCIGLLGAEGLTAQRAELGCDLYLSDVEQAAAVVEVVLRQACGSAEPAPDRWPAAEDAGTARLHGDGRSRLGDSSSPLGAKLDGSASD